MHGLNVFGIKLLGDYILNFGLI